MANAASLLSFARHSPSSLASRVERHTPGIVSVRASVRVLPDGEVRRLTFFAPDEVAPQKFIVDSYELHLNGSLEIGPRPTVAS